MKRSHFLLIVLITLFISLGAVSCGGGDDEEEAEAPAEVVDEQPAPEQPADVVAEPVADGEEAVIADGEEATTEEAVAEEVVTDETTANEEVTDEAAAEEAIGGQEGQEGVGGGAGDPTGDAVAVDPNAEAAPETAETTEVTTTTDETTPPPVDITNCDPPNVPVPTGSHYTVQACDNLYRIGLSYGLSWTVIAEANGIYYPDYIYVGQVLYIPYQPAQ